MYLYIGMILIVVVLLFVLGLVCRRSAVKKIFDMTCAQKCSLIENLTFPFGYTYIKKQDLFSSSLDAWQKRFGYTAFYDRSASHFHMIFDALPIYFDYDGRTWLIEFWKGQYGIHTGCEIGVYCADRVLSEDERQAELFHAVPEDEMMPLSLCLIHQDRCLARLDQTHWWLTAFLPGYFSNPEDLTMDACVTFPNAQMAHAFVTALEVKGYDICVCGLKICFTFHKCHECHFSRFARFYRRFIQWQNRMLCRLFLWITRPFLCSLDRVLFLFECLPHVFHRAFQIHCSSKEVRKQL